MSTWDLPSSSLPLPRGWSDDESADLDQANRRLRPACKKQPTERRRSTPRQLASGRWHIAFVISGVRHRRTFDSYQQAIEWRDRHY